MIDLDNPIYRATCNLCGGAYFVMEGDDAYDNITQWFIDTPPTKEQVEAEAVRLQDEYKSTAYQRLRSVEYPPIEDYIDGIVKGDNDQVQAYISVCLAVKAKYPKESES